MDSFSSPSVGSSPKFSTEDLMGQLKVQLAQAYAEEFLETVRGKCFEKCITKPGSSLSGSESSCISSSVEFGYGIAAINLCPLLDCSLQKQNLYDIGAHFVAAA
ncbi:unnamed protein product [Fraxinus pennsylvanica]|uniref:Mitochondrial import inner membrane translocase subunit n=1 Tax=Fraxinus pennsylvanica TaxID=56036 RepID=A0AAD1Z0N3_9LAMI|nr:unnamed protein product [Fraxinus pennsylvanica]